MSYITKIIETLGGWKQAWSLVKPSTSTTVMAIVLFILVIFFPENQWQAQEDKDEASHPLFNQTQQVEETKTTSAPQTTTSTQVEDDTNNEETASEITQDTTPTSTIDRGDSYLEEDSNAPSSPQPHQGESTQNTPDNMQGGENNTNMYNAPNDDNVYPSQQNQEPTPEENTPVQTYNGEENTNQQ